MAQEPSLLKTSRVILVVLRSKTPDRWQMAPGILRLLVSARN